MASIFAALQAFVIWLLTALGLAAKPRFIARMSDHHPSLEELGERDLVVVQSGPHVKWACLICPCGCGDKIALSLAPQRRPRWTVTLDRRKRPTVSPSVWQRGGCYSHFWIKNGEVEWCIGSGQAPVQ
jgi:hypothetical protein